MRGRRHAIMLGMGAAGIAAAAPPARVYTVARIGSAIDEAQIVGARRAGMMCLPNGAIRWGDVVSGTQGDQREAVQDAVEDAGLAVTPLGIGADRALRLRGVVRAARFALCARRYLGGGRGALSGDASIEIEWRVEDPAGGAPASHLSTIARHIDAGRAAPLGAIYRAMLGDAARDAAAWLKAP